jgi:outer membrane protein
MNLIVRTTFSLLTIAAAAGSLPAAAQSPCTAPSPDCAIVGDFDLSVSVGYGTRTNPVTGREDIPLYVIPQVSYYGKRFFLESLEPGVTLYESDANTFNLIATPGYDRVFFSRHDLQNVIISSSLAGGDFQGRENPPTPSFGDQAFPVPRRHTTYLAGPEWLFRWRDFIGQVDALYEVTGRHKGYELRAGVSAPLIQTKQSLVVNAGWTWKSAEAVDYYYGVDTLYKPGGAFNPFIKLSYAVPLSERWTLTAFVHYEYLDDSIYDSPIVSDHEVITAFAGLKFKVL